MRLSRDSLKVLSIAAACLGFVVMGIDSGSSAPCRRCDTWGQIKCCYSGDSCGCDCGCTKDFETLYYYYLYYLGSDPRVSPNDIRTGIYSADYEKWRLPRVSNRAPAESRTWGAIKSLFSAK